MEPDRLQYDLFRLVAPLAAFFLACLLASALRREGKRPVLPIYAVYLVGTIGYLVTNTLEICSRTPEASLFWSRMIYLFVPELPVVWLEFCHRFTHTGRGMRPALIVALSVVPLVSVICVFSDAFMPLMWSSFTWFRQGPWFISLRGHGLWFFIYVAYTYSVFITGAGLVIFALVRYRPYYRRQAFFIAGAIAFPLVVSALYVFRPFPGLVKDYTCLAYAVSGILFYPALFKRDLFSLQPVARSLVVEKLRDAVLVLDGAARLVDANPAALELLGFGEERIGLPLLSGSAAPRPSLDGEPCLKASVAGEPAAGSDADDATACGVAAKILAVVRDAASMHGSTEFFIQRGGEERWYSAEVTPIGETRGNSLVTIRDETEVKRLLRRIGELANTDELTGLPNRRSFMREGEREVSRALRHSSPLAVAMFDLDGFKRLNDTYGHAMGDVALHEFGSILLSEVRGEDVVGRIGGEEFALVLPGAGEEGARAFCERIRSRLEATPFADHYGERIAVTVSSGFVVMGEERLGLDALLSRADNALYRAKDKGKNRVERYGEEAGA
jgi:diguanylate cyclase (GGDEF)-like protein